MKSFKKVFIIIFILFGVINVNAEDYKPLELIPINEEANLCTETFSYDNFLYDASYVQNNSSNSHVIRFKNIQNLDTSKHNVSVSIGLFDDDKRNLGVFNVCNDTILDHNEGTNLEVVIDNDLLQTDDKVDSIKYFSIMGDNLSCKKTMDFDYYGRKAEFIEYKDDYVKENVFVKYLIVIIITVIVTLVSKFIFDITINKDGKLTKKIIGEEQVDKRTSEEIKNQYYEKLMKKKENNKKVVNKNTIKDISQEKDNTDLHNFYK